MEEQKPPQHHTHVNVTNVIQNRASARAAVRRPPRRRRRRPIKPLIEVVVVLFILLVIWNVIREMLRPKEQPASRSLPTTPIAPLAERPLDETPTPASTVVPAQTAETQPAPQTTGSYFLQFGESRTFTTASYSRLRVTSDWPIKIDFGDCHSSPTREYDCETDPSSQLTLTDSRVASMPESARNEVKVEFSNQ